MGKGKVYSEYQLAMAAEEEINACADEEFDYGDKIQNIQMKPLNSWIG
jgi:hypothetical protein